MNPRCSSLRALYNHPYTRIALFPVQFIACMGLSYLVGCLIYWIGLWFQGRGGLGVIAPEVIGVIIYPFVYLSYSLCTDMTDTLLNIRVTRQILLKCCCCCLKRDSSDLK